MFGPDNSYTTLENTTLGSETYCGCDVCMVGGLRGGVVDAELPYGLVLVDEQLQWLVSRG